MVEDVDVHFCRQNFSDKLDLGNKYEEAGKEGKDCCPQQDNNCDLAFYISLIRVDGWVVWLLGQSYPIQLNLLWFCLRMRPDLKL